MSAVVSTVKLHLNNRTSTFLIPLNIAGLVAVISVLLSLVYWRSGSQPGTADWIEGSQSNPGMAYSFAGFLVYLGVASVALTFPFALTLGATRRAFVVGTLLWDVITATYIAVIFAALSMLETATDHWFVGFYIFDINILGAGNIGLLLTIVFLGVLTALTAGGLFAAAWVRHGALGPQLVAGVVVVVLAVAAIIVVPEAATIMTSFRSWWLAVAAGVAIGISSVGTWLLLRPATVR